MRIRDEKLKNETKQLERTYKICKQELRFHIFQGI